VSHLQGKVAVVTGSSSGIGAAIARSLAADGATVVVNSSSSVEAGEAVAREIGGTYLQADIADEAQAARLVGETTARHGRLDVLVNNAGTTTVIPHHDLDALTPEVWHRILDVNVLGTWFVTRAAVPHLRASGEGCIVNITSVAGVRATGSSIPYAVSKAALNHLTVLLANVVGPEVRVNAVAPGLVDTPWTEDWDAIREAVRQRAPLGRSGVPDDVAAITMGLIRSAYVTGQVVLVDGGLSIR
jgi:ketoreductase RED2